jgi:hypothetical protein
VQRAACQQEGHGARACKEDPELGPVDKRHSHSDESQPRDVSYHCTPESRHGGSTATGGAAATCSMARYPDRPSPRRKIPTPTTAATGTDIKAMPGRTSAVTIANASAPARQMRPPARYSRRAAPSDLAVGSIDVPEGCVWLKHRWRSTVEHLQRYHW